MESYKKLLLANKAWVQDRLSADENYFEEMAKDQKPEFLWIGCSDSRVPAEEITGTDPGELFVHRNIANLVVHTDLNILSVLKYAVEVLKVKHIIVCGHYGCGGIKSALTRKPLGLINRWLQHIKDVYRLYSRELEAIADQRARLDRLVELNTIEQVQNLAQTSIVQRAWRTMNQPTIHGWIYDMHTGQLKELAQMTPGTKLDDIYVFDYGEDPSSDPGVGER
jgi:carbonic anhydrase